MSKIARNVLLLVAALVVAFAAGNFSGLFFYPKLFTETETQTAAAEDEEFDDHLPLTKQAFENLHLKLGKVTKGDYWKSHTVPGEVIEIPGKSDLSVSAPVTGVVDEVFVRPGQALGTTGRLFSLRITDEQLTTSQSKLLASISRQDVVQQEIARLAPLTESGTVTGRRKRDLEYELSQLTSEQGTLMQEILARGLPESALQDIVASKSLANTLTISVPHFVDAAVAMRTKEVSLTTPPDVGNYSIETVNVHPGMGVKRGDALCSLAYHAELYIQGTAFESDLAALSRITAEGWTVTAEFGHEHRGDHTHLAERQGLQLLHVDNHVDRETQTFKFYLPLKNEVSQSTVDERGQTFLQWRFKPGQRVHLKLPFEHWKDQLMLPLDAVVIEGPNAYVFVEHEEHLHLDHDGHSHAEDNHDDHDIFVELEPVPVRLLHRDSRMVVVANDGQIPLDKRVALNNAYKLQLAMKTQVGGGAAHAHDHPH